MKMIEDRVYGNLPEGHLLHCSGFYLFSSNDLFFGCFCKHWQYLFLKRYCVPFPAQIVNTLIVCYSVNPGGKPGFLGSHNLKLLYTLRIPPEIDLLTLLAKISFYRPKKILGFYTYLPKLKSLFITGYDFLWFLPLFHLITYPHPFKCPFSSSIYLYA